MNGYGLINGRGRIKMDEDIAWLVIALGFLILVGVTSYMIYDENTSQSMLETCMEKCTPGCRESFDVTNTLACNTECMKTYSNVKSMEEIR